jgi:glycine amidinotransferase
MSAVSSFNEWDPLEEVIVGTARGAVRSPFEPALSAYFPQRGEERSFEGEPFGRKEIDRAEQQLDNFASLLEKRGITVRRPLAVDHATPFATPDFAMHRGHGQTCPRDVLLVIGDEIIEATMAQRARYFEYRAYRPLVKEYFKGGARWTTAPKPCMDDALYVPDYSVTDEPFDFAFHPGLTEHEPGFDAASFMRCGRDILWRPDLVSNQFGADWLQRHLGPDFRIHRIEFHDRMPQHLDTTFVPLRPYLAIVNPERPFKAGSASLLQENGWKLVEPPPSIRNGGAPHARDVSIWISLNILSLDENTVVVDEAEQPLIDFLCDLGCDVLTCKFDAVFRFGGSFHCCTTDIRRAGTLQSYFPDLD